MLPPWNYIQTFFMQFGQLHIFYDNSEQRNLIMQNITICCMTDWICAPTDYDDGYQTPMIIKDVQDASVQEERLRCAVKDTRLVHQEPCDMCRIPCTMSWNHATFIKFHISDIMIHVMCTMKHVVAPCNIILYRIVTPLLHNVPQNWTTPDI